MNINLLHEILRSGTVVTDSAVLGEFSVDGIAPEALVCPENLDQAAEIVKLANRQNWAVIPWGARHQDGSRQGSFAV